MSERIISRGITVAEILVSVTVLAIITVMVIIALGNFRTSQAMNDAEERIVTLFDEAKSKTIASENLSQYGIHLESNSVVLFSGATYVTAASSNKTYTLDALLEIVNISLAGGGDDVVYEQLTGGVDEYGTFDLRVIEDTSNSRTFTITQTGIIEVE